MKLVCKKSKFNYRWEREKFRNTPPSPRLRRARQDDKYGRILAWVWVKCETNEPKFLPANYMHLSGNESRDYVAEKPEGCREGELINKTMVDKNRAEKVEYEKRGRLKYQL